MTMEINAQVINARMFGKVKMEQSGILPEMVLSEKDRQCLQSHKTTVYN